MIDIYLTKAPLPFAAVVFQYAETYHIIKGVRKKSEKCMLSVNATLRGWGVISLTL